MRRIEEAARGYGSFVGKHPFIMIAVVLMLSGLAWYGNSILESVVEDNSDMIPDTYEEIAALNRVGDEFGGTDSGVVVVEIQPVNGRLRIKDVRSYEVLAYTDLLAEKIRRLQFIYSANTAADLVKDEGRIPRNQRDIINTLADNPYAGSYVSGDHSITLVRMNFISGPRPHEIYSDINSVIESTPAPTGVYARPSGDFAVDVSMQEQMGPDMQRTSRYSMIGVLFVIIMLFRSIRYGLTSITAIIFGVMWTFGLMGLLGLKVTNVTSGGASMIMGIGIDFGIQVVSRFRIEQATKRIMDAMGETIRTVSVPMGTTTLAALIGFRAMSIGELKVLSDLATMMSLGVLCCMIAALTVVPSALVFGEKIFGKD